MPKNALLGMTGVVLAVFTTNGLTGLLSAFVGVRLRQEKLAGIVKSFPPRRTRRPNPEERGVLVATPQ